MSDDLRFEKMIAEAFEDCLTDPSRGMAARGRFRELMALIDRRLKTLEAAK